MFDSVSAELVRRGTPLTNNGITSLHHHLQGVHATLETWGEAEDVCIAGLMHRAYAPDGAGHPIYAVEERDAVRSLVGARAERLISLFEATRAGGETQTAGAGELRDVIAIRIADMAHQRCAPGGFPVAWLCEAAALATSISANPVPVFARGTATVSRASEEALLAAYADAWRAPLDERHESRLRNAVDAIPFVAEPFVLLALLAVRRGELVEAARLAAVAERILLEWGTAWDKRLTEANWLSVILFLMQIETAPERMAAFITKLVDEIVRGGNAAPDMLYVRLSALELLPTTVDEQKGATTADEDEDDDIFSDDDFVTMPARFCDFLDGLLAPNPKRALAQYPGLRAQPWWDPQDFPIVKALEAAAQEIAAEFAALDPRTFHEESERIEREGNWEVCILYERGRRREERCEAVPTTMSIIEEHSTLRTQAGLVYFSRLTPGSIIAPHHGPTNVRLRCHLGIRVPDGCGISVDNTTRTWEEGKCIVFDDSFTHAVWNSSSEDRVVLIVDIWHPDLDPREIELLSGLHQYGMSVAQGLNKYWQKNDAALVAAN